MGMGLKKQNNEKKKKRNKIHSDLKMTDSNTRRWTSEIVKTKSFCLTQDVNY